MRNAHASASGIAMALGASASPARFAWQSSKLIGKLGRTPYVDRRGWGMSWTTHHPRFAMRQKDVARAHRSSPLAAPKTLPQACRTSHRISRASFVLAVATWMIAAPHVSAHSWYPPHCCTGQDCRKVDRIDYLPDGGLLMHFGGQQVEVPRGFSQQPSQDTDAHVCVFRSASGRWMPTASFCRPGLSPLATRASTWRLLARVMCGRLPRRDRRPRPVPGGSSRSRSHRPHAA